MHWIKEDDEVDVLAVYDDLSESESEEEDIEHSDDEEDVDVTGYSVENAYIEEKEESVLALKEIAEYTE